MQPQGEGWFADPQDARRLRWWDGAQWTTHVHDPATWHQEHRPELSRSWPVLAVALQVALLVMAAAAAFAFWVDLEVLEFSEEVSLRPEGVSLSEGERIDRLLLLTSANLLAMLVTGVLFISWLYTAHHSARMDRSALKHSSGWAIGGWFVPVLNFWRPFQMVSDVRRGALGDASAPVPLKQGWWWCLFAVGYPVNWAIQARARGVDGSPETNPSGYLDMMATASQWDLGLKTITVVSALLGIAVVRDLTRTVLAPRTAVA